jgi:hypothetical protein
MTVNPRRDREKYKEEERKKQEELKRGEETEARRAAEEQRKQLRESQRYSQPIYQPYFKSNEDLIRENRRKLVKTIGIGIVVVASVGLGGIVYLSSLQNTPQVPIQQTEQPTEQQIQTSEETQASEEVTPTETQENPDDWPMKYSMQEVKDAQRELGSRCQYQLYDIGVGETAIYKQIPENGYINISQDEFRSFYGDAWAAKFYDYEAIRAAFVYSKDFNDATCLLVFVPKSHKEYDYSYGGVDDISQVLRVWDPNDPNDKVQVLRRNSDFKEIFSG